MAVKVAINGFGRIGRLVLGAEGLLRPFPGVVRQAHTYPVYMDILTRETRDVQSLWPLLPRPDILLFLVSL